VQQNYFNRKIGQAGKISLPNPANPVMLSAAFGRPCESPDFSISRSKQRRVDIPELSSL